MSSGAVEVCVYGALAGRLGATSAFQPARRTFPAGSDSRIADILASLEISPDEVSHLFLNGVYSAPTRRVGSGDRLAVFGRDMALLYRQYFPKVTDPA
jgi:hypothetical protein